MVVDINRKYSAFSAHFYKQIPFPLMLYWKQPLYNCLPNSFLHISFHFKISFTGLSTYWLLITIFSHRHFKENEVGRVTVQCWCFSDFLLMNKINSNMCSQLSLPPLPSPRRPPPFPPSPPPPFSSSSPQAPLLIPLPLFFFLKFMSVPESTQLHTTNSKNI